MFYSSLFKSLLSSFGALDVDGLDNFDPLARREFFCGSGSGSLALGFLFGKGFGLAWFFGKTATCTPLSLIPLCRTGFPKPSGARFVSLKELGVLSSKAAIVIVGRRL